MHGKKVRRRVRGSMKKVRSGLRGIANAMTRGKGRKLGLKRRQGIAVGEPNPATPRPARGGKHFMGVGRKGKGKGLIRRAVRGTALGKTLKPRAAAALEKIKAKRPEFAAKFDARVAKVKTNLATRGAAKVSKIQGRLDGLATKFPNDPAKVTARTTKLNTKMTRTKKKFGIV